MAGSSGADLRAPIFNGENSDFWQIKMKTIFRSHDLWDMVEKGYNPPAKKEEEELTAAELKHLKKNMIKDAKALGIIQGAVPDEIFPRIAILETVKEAWDILKQEFIGDKQVRYVKLQSLRRDFEYTRMGEHESFSVYLVRLLDLITQMKSYGESIGNQRIVQKLLINLPRSYDSIVAVIENTRDLETVDVQDVVATLKGYEQRIERHSENSTKKAFASLSIAPRKNNYNGNQNFKPIKNWKTKGNFTRSFDSVKNACKYCDKLHFGECWFKGKPRCHNCDKLGHFAKDCRSKKVTQQANYANQVESNPTMFYVCMFAAVKKGEDIWYVDSGCSNHMTGREDLLENIDRSVTAKVEMGTGDLVNVVGKGELMVATKQGKRYIKEIMLVPGLKENLLSVGQMMEHGYYLVFEGIEVRIYEDFTCSNLVVKIPMKGNRSFPLKLQPGIQIAMRASVRQAAEIWHRRLGHLNMNALMQLQEHDMVTGLPGLRMNFTVCEGCVIGKHFRDVFPKETNWRAELPLELIYTDICGPMQTPTKAGNKYFITFTDDCTRMGWVYFLRNKYEAFGIFKRFKATIELQSGFKMKKLRSDKGGEYTSLEFSQYYEDLGLERQLTVAYSPQQNGVAERRNMTIVEMAKCMMLEERHSI
ncbi:unnamed protein product [Malus baccata var. baccata]